MALDSTLAVESINCDSCALTEECTPEYIAEVRERYNGRWICGLCAEAVKDEVKRSGKMISTEEALNRHINFCKEFRARDKSTDPISAIGKILRKILESRRRPPARSNSSRVAPNVEKIPAASLFRSESSCLASLSR